MTSTVLTFDASTHTYRLNGSVIPNVTLITGSLASYAGVPAAVLEKARQRGEAVHYATELYDLGDLDMSSVPESVLGYLLAWQKFRDDTGFVPFDDGIEARVHSETYRYAGTIDRAGTFERMAYCKPTVPVLLDLKATYTLLAAVEPQTAGYMAAWNETRTPKLKRRFAVHLKKDGTYHLHECREPSDLSVFLAALTCHNWKARNVERGATAV